MSIGSRCRLPVKSPKSFKYPSFKGMMFSPLILIGFYPLGDILEKSYVYPTKKVMMVLDKGDELVSPPISFTFVIVMELGSTYCDSRDGCASVGGHRPFRPVLIDESSVDGE